MMLRKPPARILFVREKTSGESPASIAGWKQRRNGPKITTTICPSDKQIAGLVGASSFWLDYAKYDGNGSFLSTHFADASHKLHRNDVRIGGARSSLRIWQAHHRLRWRPYDLYAGRSCDRLSRRGASRRAAGEQDADSDQPKTSIALAIGFAWRMARRRTNS